MITFRIIGKDNNNKILFRDLDPEIKSFNKEDLIEQLNNLNYKYEIRTEEGIKVNIIKNKYLRTDNDFTKEEDLLPSITQVFLKKSKFEK